MIFRPVRFLFDFPIESMFLGYKILLENIAKKEPTTWIPGQLTWVYPISPPPFSVSRILIDASGKMNMSRIFYHSPTRITIRDKI
jgi:hypothetical protein